MTITGKTFNAQRFRERMHGKDYLTFEAKSMGGAKAQAKSQNTQTRRYNKGKGYQKYSHIIIASGKYEGEDARRFGTVNVYSFMAKMTKV